MSVVIYKYALNEPHNRVTLPVDAELLTVQLQNGMPHLWALVDTREECPTKVRFVIIIATGQVMPDRRMKYISTFFTQSGLVYHAWEELQ